VGVDVGKFARVPGPCLSEFQSESVPSGAARRRLSPPSPVYYQRLFTISPRSSAEEWTYRIVVSIFS
jgi:hypothetical protein